MSEQALPENIISRLRQNLKSAGIAFTEADIEGMVDKGFVHMVADFEKLDNRTYVNGLPDYLAGRGDSREPQSPLTGATPSTVPASRSVTGYPTIAEIAGRLQRREVSPVELTEQSLSRIAERDPILNAFQLVLADYARQQARQAEQEIANGQYRGPLHGVPLAVKDLLAMKGTITTAGSKILAQNLTDYDAAGVERLEAAGAIIVGKTRMSEFAYSPGSNNGHYGPTRNPHNLEFDTGGSSSGSGAAIADGLVFGALGSDTGGSIRMPSSQCGIVGLKPTFGRVSLYGGVTLSWSLDHLGPMTHSVTDAALMMQVLAGHDPRDIRSRPVAVPDYTADLEKGVKGLRIGVPAAANFGSITTPETVAAWRNGLNRLAAQGAELVELDLPQFEDARVLNYVILALEALAFHEANLRDRLSEYGEFMRQRILYSYAFGPAASVKAQQARQQLRLHFDSLFSRIDLLSTPTMPGGAPRLGVPPSTALTSPFNLLGWPTISVPTGKTSPDGLPLGLQLAGKPWDEVTVLRAAYALEGTDWQS